jgi:molybdenum cofactor guanylyltransferase
MSKTAAVILAGGQGRRLGGIEKALVEINGTRLIERVRERLAPQCLEVALSLRAQQAWTEPYAMPVILDRPTSESGPLGGIAAALHWAQSLDSRPKWVVTAPVDLPFLPNALVQKLTSTDADIGVAHSMGQTHYAVAAWRPHLFESLERALLDGPIAIRHFQSEHSVALHDWSPSAIDPFFNVNTAEDIETAEVHADALDSQ